MAERPVYSSAVPLSFGLALIGVGVILAWWLPDDRRDGALAPLGLGLCFLVLGVYRLVDNLDRAARAMVERDRSRA